MKQRVEMKIAGQVYRIASELDPDYVKSLADYLERKIERIQKRTRIGNLTGAIVLAALDVTDELHQEKAQREKDNKEQQKAQQRSRGELASHLKRLTKRMDRALADLDSN